MKQPEPGVLPAGLVDLSGSARPHPLAEAGRFVRKTLVIAGLEARKLRHDPTELVTRAVQPALWLLIFGQVFTRIRAIPTGTLRYLDFMAPGILAQSVLFIAIFYGVAVIWERDLGIVHKFLVTPTPRAALVLGKSLSAGIRALSQALIVYLLAVLLGVRMNWHPLALAGVLTVVMLGAAAFSTFSLIVACLVKTRERFMGIGQVLTMPLFFASNAIYPIAVMPGWLQVVSHGNPLTYEVDALRSLMLAGGVSLYGVGWDLLASPACWPSWSAWAPGCIRSSPPDGRSSPPPSSRAPLRYRPSPGEVSSAMPARRSGWSRWLLVPALLTLTALPAAAAPFLAITAGVGIGPITIGMPIARVAPTLHLQVTPKVSGDRVVYDYGKVGLTVWATDNQVVKVATRNPFHKTSTGVRPGQPWSDSLVSVCRGAAYTAETARGYEISCPFVGIGFEVAGAKLVAISVFRASARK